MELMFKNANHDHFLSCNNISSCNCTRATIALECSVSALEIHCTRVLLLHDSTIAGRYNVSSRNSTRVSLFHVTTYLPTTAFLSTLFPAAMYLPATALEFPSFM